jgi:2,4-dienoyl-CoA reductase-like NADH-dependent reductase (Old Yellow Enzyme family)
MVNAKGFCLSPSILVSDTTLSSAYLKSAILLPARLLSLAMLTLLEPVTVGRGLTLRNRVAMASMTRNRCVDSLKPGPAQVKYYADRARDGPGIIVSEGTLVDWAGLAWKYAPCMISNEHAEAWREVVDAVHKEGARMYFQAWHAGTWLPIAQCNLDLV